MQRTKNVLFQSSNFYILLALVALVVSPLVESSTYPQGSRVGGALLHFEFAHEECEVGTFTDSTSTDSLFGNLVRTEHTGCNIGLGVTLTGGYSRTGAAQVVSTADASAFTAFMNGKPSYTVELWIAPEIDSGASAVPRPIVTMGAVGDQDPNTCSAASAGGHGTYGLTMYDRQDNSKVYFAYGSEAGTSTNDQFYCPELASPGSTSLDDTAVHLVVTVSDDSGNDASNPNLMSWYVDGAVTASSNSGPGSVQAAALWSEWDTAYHLQLFGDTRNSSSVSVPFNGAIYSLAFYDFALNASQVLQNFEAKLPDSPPVVSNAVEEVNEDGMAAAMRNDPDAYYDVDGVAATSLMAVELSAEDQDEDSGYPNYVASNQATSYMKVFLSSLPELTTLYTYSNGSEITSVPAEVPPVFVDLMGAEYTAEEAAALSNMTFNKTYRVRVRPPKDQFSSTDGNGDYLTFENFTFYAVDGLTGERSSSDATLSFVVKPMNDPPKARSFRTFVQAGVTTAFALNGTDADNSLDFKNAYITKYPSHGLLYSVDPSTGLTNNCSLPDPAAQGERSWVYSCRKGCAGGNCTGVSSVAYLFTDWPALTVMDDTSGQVASDSFEYQLVDALGFNSSTATVSVVVTTPLSAVPSSAVASAYEKVATTLELGGRDYSTDNRDLVMEVVTLPSQGTLQDASTGATLSAGDVLSGNLSWPQRSTLKVTYTSADNGFFSTPTTNWDGTAVATSTSTSASVGTNDYFTFRVRSFDGSSLVSLDTTQEVDVVNVNDPSKLTGPTNAGSLDIYARSILQSSEDGDDSLFPTTLTIRGLNLTSAHNDGDVDAVKCRIACDNGVVTINPANVGNLDFTSAAYCFDQTLNCKNPFGDGYQETVFVGPPSDVAVALTDITYQSSVANVEDSCEVLVYDGGDANCVPSSQLSSRRDGSHTSDSSGDSSSFSSRTDLAAGSTSSPNCYTLEVNFTVNVLDYAVVAAATSDDGCGYDICLPWYYWVACVSVGFMILVGICMAIQTKYQAEIRALIGLDLYDVLDDEMPMDQTAVRLMHRNKPSNWIKVKAVPPLEALAPGSNKTFAAPSPPDKNKPEDDLQFYYVNTLTGEAQWERPLFSVGPPSVADHVPCFGPENDPATWQKVHAVGSQPYYFNLVTKRSTWSAPKFSRNWEAEKAQREKEEEEEGDEEDGTGGVGRWLSRRASSWLSGSTGAPRGISGFSPLFGPGSAQAASAPRSTRRKKEANKSKSKNRGSSALAAWDKADAADPGVVLGGWTVDAKDERREAFEAAAKSILREGGGCGGSAVVATTWGDLADQAERELEAERLLRFEATSSSPKHAVRAVAFGVGSGQLRKVERYGPSELAEIHGSLKARGVIATQKEFGAEHVPRESSVEESRPETSKKNKKRGSLEPSFEDIGGVSDSVENRLAASLSVDMSEYMNKGTGV